MMRILSLALFCTTIWTAAAFADTFRGELSWTLTYLSSTGVDGVNYSDPGVDLGKTYTGWYEYVSPTMDYNSDLDPFHSTNFTASIPTPIWMSYGQLYFNVFRAGVQVSDGVATFRYTFDAGALSGSIFQNQIQFGINQFFGDAGGLAGRGTVYVGAPVNMTPHGVPDAGSTLGLLALAGGGLLALRRRFAI